MANANRVMGFKPYKHLNGSAWNGQLTEYWVPASDATAIGIGDLVKLAAVSDPGGIRGVTKFVAGTDSASIGAIVGVSINPLNLNTPQYRQASTAMYVYVADSPDTVYEVQASGVVAATNFGKNINVTDAGVNTATGLSGEQIDTTTIATTATLPIKLQGAVQSITNDLTSANAKILVSINNHQLASGTGTAGV